MERLLPFSMEHQLSFSLEHQLPFRMVHLLPFSMELQFWQMLFCFSPIAPSYGEAVGSDCSFFKHHLRFIMEHHERASSNAPTLCEACFCFEVVLVWGAQTPTGARRGLDSNQCSHGCEPHRSTTEPSCCHFGVVHSCWIFPGWAKSRRGLLGYAHGLLFHWLADGIVQFVQWGEKHCNLRLNRTGPLQETGYQGLMFVAVSFRLHSQLNIQWNYVAIYRTCIFTEIKARKWDVVAGGCPRCLVDTLKLSPNVTLPGHKLWW